MSKSDVYQERRKRVQRDLDGLAYVVAAFDAMQQTNDSAAPFVQESNFLYLSGIDEPGWTLVMKRSGEVILIAPDVSETHRIFDGGLSNETALVISGVNAVITRAEGEKLLSKLLQQDKTVGAVGADPHEEHFSFTLNPAPKRLYGKLQQAATKVTDIRPVIARLRGRKDVHEIEAIQRAVEATCRAFEKVKSSLKTATHEYNLEAQFSYEFRNQGLTHAYEPIVASGANACTLHYQKNSTELPENGLVLMDVGARFNGYAADITRTYAIGMPSEREAAVHAAVEKAHHEIIALIAPGMSVKKYHEKVDEIMKAALKSLGLLKKPSDYRKYFPHAISHGLGLDVHDPIGAPKLFEPGMVLTVEPGIYIPEEGIGVRIEDDILVTKDGYENLSAGLATSL